MGCVSGTYRLRIHVRNHEAKYASDSRPRYMQKIVANIVSISPFYTHTQLTRKNARNAERCTNIQGHNGVPLQPIWGEFQALTSCEFIPETTKQNTPAIPVRGTYRNSSPTLSDFGQHSFTIHSNNTRVAERRQATQHMQLHEQ